MVHAQAEIRCKWFLLVGSNTTGRTTVDPAEQQRTYLEGHRMRTCLLRKCSLRECATHMIQMEGSSLSQ